VVEKDVDGLVAKVDPDRGGPVEYMIEISVLLFLEEHDNRS